MYTLPVFTILKIGFLSNGSILNRLILPSHSNDHSYPSLKSFSLQYPKSIHAALAVLINPCSFACVTKNDLKKLIATYSGDQYSGDAGVSMKSENSSSDCISEISFTTPA